MRDITASHNCLLRRSCQMQSIMLGSRSSCAVNFSVRNSEKHTEVATVKSEKTPNKTFLRLHHYLIMQSLLLEYFMAAIHTVVIVGGMVVMMVP